MRIAIIGGGPAGLYFACLMQRRDRRHRIAVIEQNPRELTWGFGVVFSLGALEFLRRDDPDTFALLKPRMESWPDQRIVHGDERVLIDGNGFAAIPRLELLQLLHGLAEPLGVEIRFGTTAEDLKPWLDADLVVGADGINSVVRTAFAAQFRPSIETLSNKFAWYGTAQRFDSLTLTFRASPDGAFVAHHYRYSPSMSTFIVECDAPTWERAGFARMSDAESRAYCERVFAPDLGGHPLLSNKSVWRNFPVLTNEHWTCGNVVLIGDALRSVHFSIGSGTRLAMEDALFLARAFAAEDDCVPAALARFVAERRPIVDTMLAAAANSCEWYEQFAGKMHLDAYALAYDYMTRSGRMTDARLAQVAPRFTAALAERALRPTAQRAWCSIASRQAAVPNPDPATTAIRPWLRFYGSVPPNLDYPEVTLYQAVAATAARVPDAIAWDFLDTTSTYRAFLAAIDACANALAGLGLKAGERLLISMPTSPQGVIAFYAANKLGAVPALIHPLSTAPEIEHYLNASRARIALTLDAFYERFAAVRPVAPLETLILARIPDYLSPLKKFGFWLTKGRRIPAVPEDGRVRWWADCMAHSHQAVPRAAGSTHDAAAILFSGGTTGMPKGIVLSNRNFIAEGMQAAAWGGMGAGRSILAILPIFHGFGLGVCVNAAFMAGGKSILVPMFSAAVVAKLLRTKKPNLLVGVPTLYDALNRDPSLAKADLSCLLATFSGADTLPRPVKERFEKLVAARGGRVKLLEGYGLTEAVTAIMAMPLEEYREGSIGIPFPDMLAKICRIGTTEDLAIGEEGEICVSGPAVMQGYLDDPEATRETLKVHADGLTWLHTGDLGKMDADGFFYFTVRFKRMIKSSGFNVYPAQVEAVLYRHPLVADACVAGVPDSSQVERVHAFVVLKYPALANAGTELALIEHCRAQLIKWSCPREIEFCSELPMTRVGKVDYKVLVQRHVAKRIAKGTG